MLISYCWLIEKANSFFIWRNDFISYSFIILYQTLQENSVLYVEKWKSLEIYASSEFLFSK